METTIPKNSDSEITILRDSSKLSKHIKKIFIFLSNREQDILNNLDRIKHSKFSYLIHKCYGYKSTKDYNDNCKDIIIPDNFIDNLKNEIKIFCQEETTIPAHLVDEVNYMIFTFISCQKYEKKCIKNKEQIYSKISKRLLSLKEFMNADFFDKKFKSKYLKKILPNITEDEYETIKQKIYELNDSYEDYIQTTSKRYSFIYSPKVFEEYFYQKINLSEIEFKILHKVGLHNKFKEIITLMPEMIMSKNLILFERGEVEATHFLGYPIENDLLGHQQFAKYHCGLSFGSALENYNSKKADYLRSTSNILTLKKIVWDETNYGEFMIHTFESKMLLSFTGTGFLISEYDRELYEKDILFTPENKKSKCFEISSLEKYENEVNNRLKYSISYCYKKPNEYSAYSGKPFLIFCRDGQYLSFVITVDNEVTHSIFLYNDKMRIIFHEEGKFKNIDYNCLFNFDEQLHYI